MSSTSRPEYQAMSLSERHATLQLDLDHAGEKEYAEVHERAEIAPPRRGEVAEMSNDGPIVNRPQSRAKGKKVNIGLTVYDTEDRDPNRIADDVRITFDDIIAEPDTFLYSFDQVWNVSKMVYTKTKLWVYRVVTLLFGVPIAVIWGFIFALISCGASWICVPCFKCYRINVNCGKRFYDITVDCFLAPVVVACSKIFSNIRININQSSD